MSPLATIVPTRCGLLIDALQTGYGDTGYESVCPALGFNTFGNFLFLIFNNFPPNSVLSAIFVKSKHSPTFQIQLGGMAKLSY